MLTLGTSVRAERQAAVQIVAPVGHAGVVNSVAFSPDGRFVVSGSVDNTLRLWDAATGKELRRFEGHQGEVTSVAFSPDGSRVISGSDDKTLRLWDAATGKELRRFEGHEFEVVSSAFSPDGRFIISASSKFVRLWDANSGRELRRFDGHESEVSSVAFSPDGSRIISGSYDKTLRLWDVATGREQRRFEGHGGGVTSTGFSPDGSRVISSGGHTLALWDAETGEKLRRFEGHESEVTSVGFSPDGSRLISGSLDKTLRLWDVASGKELLRIEEPVAASAVAFSPDGSQVVAGGDNKLRHWNAVSGIKTNFFAGLDKVTSVSSSPDGSLVISAGWDKTLHLWDAESGKELRRFDGHNAVVLSVAFSRDSRFLVSASKNGSLRLWDVASGNQVRGFVGHRDVATSVTFSPDGRFVVSGSVDKTLRLWDAATGEELRRFEGHEETVESIAFSPDGRLLVSGSADNMLRLWDAGSGKELRRFGGHKSLVTSVAFSQNGRLVVSGSWDRTLRLWDAATGKEVRRFEGHESFVNSVAFSPDGRLVISGSADNTLRLWDAATGKELLRLEGAGEVASVAFSPDGRTLISGSSDGTLRFWDGGDGELLATMIGTKDGDWLTLTPEGFFSASANGAHLLHAVRGFDVIKIEQVYDALYRPDLVQEKLAGDPKGLVKEAAAKLGLDKVIASGGAPQVSFLSPDTGVTMDADRVTVEAEILPQGDGGVGRIEWRVNGVTLGLEARGLSRPDGPASMKISQALDLESGDNVIELIAYNAANLIASQPARLNLKWDGESSATPPRLYVLAVGINDYWDGRLKLNHAVADARALTAAMQKAGGELYEQVNVTTLLDAEVSADGLDQAFQTMAQAVRPRDVFLFYIAGHGKTIDGRYYFIPQDFRYRGDESIVSNGIGQEKWQEWFALIRARKSVLIYDTCESGSLTGDQIAMRGLERAGALERLTRATGRTTLTAATDVAPALEGYRGHGVFTYALLDGLASADSNKNGLIEVTELAGHIDHLVPEVSHKAFGMRQVPQMRIQGSNFPIAQMTAVLEAGDGDVPLPAKPTHVVVQQAEVFAKPGGKGVAVHQLKPGAQVALVRTAEGWVLVSREGQNLGYLAEKHLAPLQ